MVIDKSKIKSDVIDVTASVLNLNKDDVKETSHFVDDLKADSLDIVELIMALEEKFDLEISDGDAKNMNSVSDIIKYLERKYFPKIHKVSWNHP